MDSDRDNTHKLPYTYTIVNNNLIIIIWLTLFLYLILTQTQTYYLLTYLYGLWVFHHVYIRVGVDEYYHDLNSIDLGSWFVLLYTSTPDSDRDNTHKLPPLYIRYKKPWIQWKRSNFSFFIIFLVPFVKFNQFIFLLFCFHLVYLFYFHRGPKSLDPIRQTDTHFLIVVTTL